MVLSNDLARPQRTEELIDHLSPKYTTIYSVYSKIKQIILECLPLSRQSGHSVKDTDMKVNANRLL